MIAFVDLAAGLTAMTLLVGLWQVYLAKQLAFGNLKKSRAGYPPDIGVG
jgi:hypothetical protein